MSDSMINPSASTAMEPAAPVVAPVPAERQNIALAMDTWKLSCSMGKAYAILPDGMVPKNYAGNQAACTVACNMAIRMNTDPVFVMQNLYVVQGNPTWSGKSCKALIDNSGIYADRSTYQMTGAEGTDERSCRLVAISKKTGEPVVGPAVSIKMAKDSGWWSKNGSYWPKMPEMMLRYRAAAYFARTECPEVLMGANIDMADGPEEVNSL